MPVSFKPVLFRLTYDLNLCYQDFYYLHMSYHYTNWCRSQ